MSIEVAAILISTVVTTSERLDLGEAKNHKTIEDSQKSSYVQYSRQVELDIKLKIGMIALIRGAILYEILMWHILMWHVFFRNWPQFQ